MKKVVSFGAIFSALAICLQVTAGGCAKKSEASAQSIVGTWKTTDFPGQRPVITFKNDGTYRLEFQDGKFMYDGIYTASGTQLHVTDLYCGKALKGLYEYAIRDTFITFKVVSDSFCDRSHFFSVPWARKK